MIRVDATATWRVAARAGGPGAAGPSWPLITCDLRCERMTMPCSALAFASICAEDAPAWAREHRTLEVRLSAVNRLDARPFGLL